MITKYGANGTDPDLAGTFAVVEYHLADAYEESWGASRKIFYNAIYLGVPFFVYDGLWDAWPYTTYESKFLTRQAVRSPVTMSVGAEGVGGNTYQVTIRTCVEPDAGSNELRIYAVAVEDYYPASPTYSRNTFRVATATSDVTLAPGECDVETREITVVPEVAESNLKLIAWAQEPNSSWPADVYQAAMEVWPFEVLPAVGDYDNDGDADLDDYAEFPDCMSGPDPGVLPDQVCRSAFDSDADDDVDLKDFAVFTESFVGGE